MDHAGVPLDNQWARWPGITYALPVQAWVGPHHSAVITGIARAGIDALIQLAGEKTPARPDRDAARESAGPGRRRARRCDPQRRAHLPQCDDRRALDRGRGRPADHPRATGALPVGRESTPPTARARRWT